MADPIALPATEPFSVRRLALRAIMDGRGLDVVILSAARSLAHYGGTAPLGGLLVVGAGEAWRVAPHDGCADWAAAAALVRPGSALGYDELAPGMLGQITRPQRMLCIASDIARQIDEAS
jgi:hypothetical protein